MDYKMVPHEESSAHVWVDIATVMNQWAQKILDAETRHSKTVSFRENIVASLQRHQLAIKLSAITFSIWFFSLNVYMNEEKEKSESLLVFKYVLTKNNLTKCCNDGMQVCLYY